MVNVKSQEVIRSLEFILLKQDSLGFLINLFIYCILHFTYSLKPQGQTYQI